MYSVCTCTSETLGPSRPQTSCKPLIDSYSILLRRLSSSGSASFSFHVIVTRCFCLCLDLSFSSGFSLSIRASWWRISNIWSSPIVESPKSHIRYSIQHTAGLRALTPTRLTGTLAPSIVEHELHRSFIRTTSTPSRRPSIFWSLRETIDSKHRLPQLWRQK